MTHRWIEDDPCDGGISVAEPSDAARVPGVASVMGLGSAVSVLLLALAAIAMVD